MQSHQSCCASCPRASCFVCLSDIVDFAGGWFPDCCMSRPCRPHSQIVCNSLRLCYIPTLRIWGRLGLRESVVCVLQGVLCPVPGTVNIGLFRARMEPCCRWRKCRTTDSPKSESPFDHEVFLSLRMSTPVLESPMGVGRPHP